jgi:hypothetical protein
MFTHIGPAHTAKIPTRGDVRVAANEVVEAIQENCIMHPKVQAKMFELMFPHMLDAIMNEES